MPRPGTWVQVEWAFAGTRWSDWARRQETGRQCRFCHRPWNLGFRSCHSHLPLTSRWETGMEWQLTNRRRLRSSKCWYLVLIYLYGNSQHSPGRGPRDKPQSLDRRVGLGWAVWFWSACSWHTEGALLTLPLGVLRARRGEEHGALEVWGRGVRWTQLQPEDSEVADLPGAFSALHSSWCILASLVAWEPLA